MPTPSETPAPADLPRLRLANAVFVTDRLAVGGDLHPDPAIALDQAEELARAGVTHVLDARIEWRDDATWAHLPGVAYHWHGIDDRGQKVPDAWFDEVTRFALAGLAEPDGVVLTHCHAGVNRGPSAGYAVLLALGWDPVDALDAIRRARPIAFVAYAEDALRWHHHRTRADRATRRRDRERVAAWRADHALDLEDVIRQVRASETRR